MKDPTRPIEIAKGARMKTAKPVKARTPFASIEDAVAAILEGQMVIVVDDEDRENEGDLTIAGETEAAVDLARIAGLYPAGVICEIMNEDGTMARVPQLARFAKKHGLLMITIADLIKYRIRTECLVKRIASARLPTEHGDFQIHAFENQLDRQTHV